MGTGLLVSNSEMYQLKSYKTLCFLPIVLGYDIPITRGPIDILFFSSAWGRDRYGESLRNLRRLNIEISLIKEKIVL